MDFTGKVALVTGGGSGIGRATVLGWAARGGRAVIADIDEARAGAVAEEVTRAGGVADVVRCDIASPADIDAAVAFTLDRHGRIDFLHNNAFAAWRGADAGAFLGDVGDAQWDHVLGVALTASFRFTRAVLPAMRRQGGGAIVNTASTAGYHVEPHVSAYSVAKGGVIQLTRATAVEYARDGIRCNAVCPGVIRTPLIEGAPLDDGFIAGIPIGRLGEAAEIANVVLFLASDLANYMTGAIVVADGGRTI